MFDAINFNRHLNYIKNNSADISISLFKCCLAPFRLWFLNSCTNRDESECEKANRFILFFCGSIQWKPHSFARFHSIFSHDRFLHKPFKFHCVHAIFQIRTCAKCQLYEMLNAMSVLCVAVTWNAKNLCVNHICVKLFASNWKTLVFSPPKTGWFIYSQRCSRHSRLMEPIQFSIGVSGSGQILYHLVGSMNVMTNSCVCMVHIHTTQPFNIGHNTDHYHYIHNYFASSIW